jgi:parallel beta-helix repeat protein
MDRKQLTLVAAGLSVLAVALTIATPAQARMRTGDISPDGVDVVHVCEDGMMFAYAVGGPGPPVQSLDVTFFATSPPGSGTIVAQQATTVPFNPIGVVSETDGTGIRNYSGIFTLPWSLQAGVVVNLGIGSPDSAGPITHTVQDCQLPVQPPECGRVITSDTKLRADIVNCVGPAIVIGADHITLDLNGHKLDGTGLGAGVDNYDGHEGVVIRRGTIQQFDAGVGVAGGRNNHLHNLTLSDNDEGIVVLESSGNRIERNTASGNKFTGVIVDASNNQVERNTAKANGPPFGEGIVLGGSNNLVEKNAVSANGTGIWLGGFLVGSATNNLVQRNTLSGDRILVDGADSNDVVRNTVSGAGIHLESSNENRIANNVVFDSANDGIGVSGVSQQNHIEGNSTFRNAGAGILIGFSGFSDGNNLVEHNSTYQNGKGIAIVEANANQVLGNRTFSNGVGIDVGGGFDERDNRIEDNLALANTEDGIRISDRSFGTLLARNRTIGNRGDGIDVDNPDPLTTLTQNTAIGNSELGIEAEPGVTDGGGNRAVGNGDPAQCVGVVCS